MAGWIKLHRKILDNPIFLKPELYQLFSYCLLRANHNETKIIWNSEEETLDKGCFLTGRKAIARDIGQNESSVYKRLKILEKLNMISLKSNNKYSVVKVLNYCIYQGEEVDKVTTKEQQSNNKVTTTEQQSNTDKNLRSKELKKDKNINSTVPKINYSESVTLTEVEYIKLVTGYGEQDTKRMIEILSNYKLSSGKKYKSDYHAILNWVVKRLAEENKRGPRVDKPGSQKHNRQFDAIEQWDKMTEGMIE